VNWAIVFWGPPGALQGPRRPKQNTGDGFGTGGVGRWADGQGTSASFYNPTGVAVDAAGLVYVADLYTHRIRKITPLGLVTTLAGTGCIYPCAPPFSNGVGTSTATFNYVFGVAVDGSGNVYVGDSGNNRIRLILPNGTVSTLAGSGSASWADGAGTLASFNGLSLFALAGNGNLLVTDANRIRMVTPLGVVSTIAGGAASEGAKDGYGTASTFESYGVTVSSNGKVFISDTINSRIRALSCVPCPTSYFCTTGVPVLCHLACSC
jgi:hypothetical protein